MKYQPHRCTLKNGTRAVICHWKDVPDKLWEVRDSAYYIPINIVQGVVVPTYGPPNTMPTRGGIPRPSQRFDELSNTHGALIEESWLEPEINAWGEVSL